MHIAVDLDNTILDTTNACVACFNRLTGICLDSADEAHYRYYEFYGWDEDMYESVYERHGNEIHWSSNPYPFAIKVVNQLFMKYRLTILTARPELFLEVSIKWLRYHGIPFHEIVFARDKFSTCQALNVDVLIDDAPHYAREFSSRGKRFVIMDQPYNRDIDHELIYRISGWSQVAETLTLL